MSTQSSSAAAKDDAHKAGDSAKAGSHDPSLAAPTIVLDLGTYSKKDIDKLQEGRGNLMREIDDALAELRASGAIEAAAQPVVVVVKQRRKKVSLRPLDALPVRLG
jgi:hypothetical protein